MNTLDITPEKRRLQQEYDELKKKFANLMLTFEEMKQQEGPKLGALYLKLFGNNKYQILNLQVEIKLLEMRKQLLQRYINRDETPDLQKISSKIEEALSAYNKILENEAQKLKDAKDYLEAPLLSEAETNEMKSLYHLLVKQLHPDLHPNQSEEDKDLFQIVQTAYALGNLEKLREISLALDAGKLVKQEDCGDHLQEYVDTLKGKVRILEQKISDLENIFPYNLKEQLFDQSWVEQEQRRDEEMIALLKEKRDHLSKIVEVMSEYKTKKL
ncbi:MAG: J domain-containing protein [Paludibacteraceae bacterium]|nr:J domain-containing protein [Paludibacteraceae bacterium]